MNISARQPVFLILSDNSRTQADYRQAASTSAVILNSVILSLQFSGTYPNIVVLELV